MSGFLTAHPPSTVSHWIATNRGTRSLHNHGSQEALPASADVVIIGAGISGALLAYHLACPEDGKVSIGRGSKIVVLEGAEVASSATGRNGGHFAPATFLSIHKLTKPLDDGGAGLTLPEATDILLQEWDNFQRNKAIIHQYKLEERVDYWEGTSMTVYDTQEQLDFAHGLYEKWIGALKDKGLEDYSNNYFCRDAAEAVKVSRVQGAVGYSTRTAGTVHPHRFATEVLKIAMASPDMDVTLHTGTPAMDISNEGVVSTKKGEIKADKVILCTNAHTPHLFPADHPLHTFIAPLRIQMGLFTPPLEYSGEKALKSSYGFPLGYCANTPNGIVVGAGAVDYINAGVGKPEDFIGSSDDSELIPACTSYLKTFMKKTMVDWDEKAEGEGLVRTWTGIIATTIDRLPLIGQVPSRSKLYISAGFNGHGMSTTNTCNRALARMLATGEWDEDFPPAYRISDERLKRKLVDGGFYKVLTGRKP
ncbi:uncharacterized protein I303_101514 [Kwoniella dejecticola CBS 10117]|uniref:FAD dependent oxidoreductase domain-containing protein n=1 Tax=Kwoniella dejecticola CBS 10117 TaxID=1296121 RepID=A0A1A6ADL7_9TREE|nr:uncharacterized protein I303_02354 [Kwoniella dejecticola CBS 10117]OBR88134.1 hypothetical protein I303_02354 [Kwoniella dejecticola CBS 10117]